LNGDPGPRPGGPLACLNIVATSCAILLAVLCATATPAPARADAPSSHLTVLLYHRFGESEFPTTNTSETEFRRQMQYLSDEGYTVLSMEEFRKHLESGEPFAPKSVLITIDDPYLSIYRVSRPILREFGFPYALFVWTYGLEHDYRAFMSWAMIDTMATEGVVIGNHTHTHPHLALPHRSETPEAYEARVHDELDQSQRILRSRGIETDLLAYPYGEYNAVVVEAARAADFTLMFTSDPGAVDTETPWDRIPRAAIVGDDMTLDDFIAKLEITPLHAADEEPRYGFLSANPPAAISLRIVEPGQFDAGIVNMFVSEWGRVDGRFDPQTGIIRFVPTEPLTRPTNRVIVSAKDRLTGKFAMTSRLLVLPFASLRETGHE